jgi:hypothetical protein
MSAYANNPFVVPYKPVRGLGFDTSSLDLSGANFDPSTFFAGLASGGFTTLLLFGVGAFILIKMFGSELQGARRKRRIRKGRAKYAKTKARIAAKYGKEALETTAF